MNLGIGGLTDGAPVGRGGFAVVYRAFQPELDRWVAVKVLAVTDETSRNRFDRERRAMGRLSQHHGIVTVYDSGYTENNEPYLVMAYHSSGSLADRLREDGPIPAAEACDLVAQLADTVSFAHSEGVLHRDIKPSNVLIGADDKPLIADFGIAQVVGGPLTSSATVKAMTPSFSAPEMLLGTGSGPATDVYGLGATLFSLLTGTRPFGGEKRSQDLGTVVEHILRSPVADLRPAGIPSAVCDVLEWAMAKAPEDRPGSAERLAEALRDAARSIRDESLSGSGGSAKSGDDSTTKSTNPVTKALRAEPPVEEQLEELLTFGLDVALPNGTSAIAVRMSHTTKVSQIRSAIASHLDTRSGQRLRRVVDGVPLSEESRVAEQVMHGQRVTFETPLGGSRSSPTFEIRIVGGPHSGERWPIESGTYSIGRDESCDVAIRDHRLSKKHAEVTVAEDAVWVEDAKSRNGTYVNGIRLGARQRVLLGHPIEIGSNLFAVTEASPPTTTDSDTLWIEHNRPPRILPPPVEQEHTVVAPPEKAATTAIQWGAILLPVVLGLALALGFRTWYMLTFALLSPALILWNKFSESKNLKKLFTGGHTRFLAELDSLVSTLESANTEETLVRHVQEPDPPVSLDHARARTDRLWHRRPSDSDFLRLRLGWADLPSRNKVVLEPGGDVELRELAEQRTAPFASVSSVPLSVSLRQVGVLGISGAHEDVDALARWLTSQVAFLHSPREVGLYAVVPAEARHDWDWVKWLPHCSGPQAPSARPTLSASEAEALAVIDALSNTVRTRLQNSGSRQDSSQVSPALVAIVYGMVVRNRALLADILKDGPAVGVSVIWIEEHADRLPGECKVVARIDPNSSEIAVTYVDTGGSTTAGGFDGVSVSYCRDMAEALAPLRDAGAGLVSGGVPERIDLPETLGLRSVSSSVFLKRWAEAPGGLWAPIGASAAGVFGIDLERDGPHGLVGGMTNAGKSEFLQTLVLGLASTYSPERFNLLLIDYKGGTAFKDCVALPHTVGLITDLDEHLVERALTSLQAEIRRRERLLRDTSAKDLTEMRRLAPDRAPPSLVIVVDEFYALATELPEFIVGMVDVASRGRALGLHLILATQRPADSVVNENIRANSNLRVSLRVANDHDSVGIIGTADAARISKATPGRAFIRTGHDELVQVQTAFSGGSGLDTPSSGEIEIQDIGFSGNLESGSSDHAATGRSDTVLLVEAMAGAAAAAGLEPPIPPWLPELGELIRLEEMEQDAHGDRAVLGLMDLPDLQSQRPWVHDLSEHGNLVVYGATGSGKTTLLRTLVGSLAIKNSPQSLHIYGLDFSTKGLAAVDRLPHCGGVVYAGDNERTLRLLSQIEQEISERKNRFAEAGVSSLSELRALEDSPLPRILLLLDAYGGFHASMQEVDHGRPVDRFNRILADGHSVGVNVVMTATRKAEVPGAISGMISSYLVLRLANEDEYFGLGMAAKSLNLKPAPGRGFVNGLSEVQVTVLSDDGSLAAQAEALLRLARKAEADHPGSQATPIRVLPAEVPISELPTAVSALSPLLGLEDESLEPVAIDLANGPFLIVGPPRSGRTTALRALANSIRQTDPQVEMHLLAPRRSLLADLDWWSGVHKGAVECDEFGLLLEEGLAQRSFDSPTMIVVIDDGEELTDSPAARSLESVLRRGRDVGVRVIGACEVQSAHRAFGSWVSEAKKQRSGLLLSPDFDVDGDIFAVRLPRTTQRQLPPGRGFLVERGTVRLVQVAT